MLRFRRRPPGGLGPASRRTVVLVVAAVTIAGTPASSAWAEPSSRAAAVWSGAAPTSIGQPAGRSNIPAIQPAPEDAGPAMVPASPTPPDPPAADPAPPVADPAPTGSEEGSAGPEDTVADQGTDGDPAGAVLAIEERTGVPDGTILTPRTGTLTITTPGYVLENVDLQGCLVIKASDVVVRNSRITCGSPPGLAVVQVSSGAYRFTIEDSEVDGDGRAQIGIGFSNITARRVEVRNTVDGLRASWRVVLEDSWIHDMVRVGDLHPDAVQTTGGTGIVIRGNTLDPMTPGYRDYLNSAIMMGSETSDAGLNDVLVENNVLNGGNYTVNMRADTVFSNVVFRNNVFGATSRYGPLLAPPGITVEGSNILQTTGLTIRVSTAR